MFPFIIINKINWYIWKNNINDVNNQYNKLLVNEDVRNQLNEEKLNKLNDGTVIFNTFPFYFFYNYRLIEKKHDYFSICNRNNKVDPYFINKYQISNKCYRYQNIHIHIPKRYIYTKECGKILK